MSTLSSSKTTHSSYGNTGKEIEATTLPYGVYYGYIDWYEMSYSLRYLKGLYGAL